MTRRAEEMCQYEPPCATVRRRPVDAEERVLTERKEEDGMSPLTVASPILFDRSALVL